VAAAHRDLWSLTSMSAGSLGGEGASLSRHADGAYPAPSCIWKGQLPRKLSEPLQESPPRCSGCVGVSSRQFARASPSSVAPATNISRLLQIAQQPVRIALGDAGTVGDLIHPHRGLSGDNEQHLSPEEVAEHGKIGATAGLRKK
jgi:hypothetical protein